MITVLAHGGVLGASLEFGVPIIAVVAIFWFTRKSRKRSRENAASSDSEKTIFWGSGGSS